MNPWKDFEWHKPVFSRALQFFFKLFADHSTLPSRLHYETMLRYFAADPDPREGFIRALSLVLGKQVKSPSQDQLVQVKKTGKFAF